jgi:hypothetical protein
MDQIQTENQFQISDQAQPLLSLLVDEAAYVAGAHESMRDEAAQWAARHNLAIALMTATAVFATAWAKPITDNAGVPVLGENSAGSFQVSVDSICINLRGLAVPTDRPDPETMHRDVLAVAGIDPKHPVAQHWRVLADRCVAPGASLHWEDVAALVGA